MDRAKQSSGNSPGGAIRLAAFLLCGGLGTRLRGVTEEPKAVIEVAGWPFLRYHIKLLEGSGCQRTIFLTGHGARAVERTFGPPSPSRIFIREKSPLGTGGALGNAVAWAGQINLVANGDSFVDVSVPELMRVHRRDRGTVVASWVEDRADYGGIEVDESGRILHFHEKGKSGPGWINAGLYLFDREFLEAVGEGASSLERDHFPGWAKEGRLYAHRVKAFFRDIGTPDRLIAAQQEFRSIRSRFDHEIDGDTPR